MSEALTAVDKYLESKKLSFRVDGDQAILQCPFCNEGDKFYINRNNYLFQCKRGSCKKTGNQSTLKAHFGDAMDGVPASALQGVTAPKTMEKVPEVEEFHQALLDDLDMMNMLNDERGFSTETIKAAKLGLGKRKFGDTSTPALMFPYFEGSECVGIKYRSLPPEKKDFRFTQGREPGLYRRNVIVKDMDFLCLLEGESDTLSLVENGINEAVGVPGCDGKKITWDKYLELPKKLYLIFDNDEAGQDGAKAFATRFGIERFHNVVLPPYELDEPVPGKNGELRTTIKDVNEFFLTGHTIEEFRTLLENAEPFGIDGVSTMGTAFTNLIKQYNERGTFDPKYKFLWPSLNARARGIDDGDLIIILAPAKTGKTTMCLNQLEFMVHEYAMNVHFECMEMTAEALTKKWAAMILQTDENSITLEQILEAERIHKNRPNGFIFSSSQPKTDDDLLDSIRATHRRYGTGATVIDNLQLLVDTTLGRGNLGNRVNYISAVTKKLKRLAGELKQPIFLISQPKGVKDGEMVGAGDSEGSTAPSKDCDLFITVNRAKEGRMKSAQADAIGNLQTNASHSDNMYVEVALTRRSPGGITTLKMEGHKSLIREYTTDEMHAVTKQGMIDGIVFTDDNDLPGGGI